MANSLETLESRKKNVEKSLRESSTAYAPNTLPSSRDMGLSSQLSSVNKQIETLKSTNLRNRWYGPQDVPAEETGDSDGWFVGALKGLQKPMNVMAGTAQYALGEGTKSDLASNINEAMSSGLTFGNILKQKGYSRAVQVPLGFALDVMFDPINWLTVGTSALIPRVGTGLIKGGMKKAAVEGAEGAIESGLTGALKGASTGLSSNLQRTSSFALNLMPFTKRIASTSRKLEALAKTGVKVPEQSAFGKAVTKGAIGYNEFVEKLGKKAFKNTTEYDRLIGESLNTRLNKNIWGNALGKEMGKAGVVGEKLENLIKKIPAVPILGKTLPSGERIVELFNYSTIRASKIAELKDKVAGLAKDRGIVLVRGGKGVQFKRISDFEKPGATITKKELVEELIDGAKKEADGLFYKSKNIPIRNKETGALLEGIEEIGVHDTLENAKYLLGARIKDINMDHLIAAYKVTEPGKTGFQWYDDVISKLKNTTIGDLKGGKLGAITMETVEKDADDLVKAWNSYDRVIDLKPFEKVLTAYPTYTAFFKLAKVPMNVGSFVVATVGNFFMGMMMGLPVSNPTFISCVKQSSKLLNGKLGAKEIEKIFYSDVDSLFDMMKNNPNMFRKVSGFNPKEVSDKLEMTAKMLNLTEGATQEEIKKFLIKGLGISSKISAKKVAEIERLASKTEREALKLATKEKYPTGFSTGSETAREMAKDAPLTDLEKSTSFIGELSNEQVDAAKNWFANFAKENPNNPIASISNTMINSMPRWYEHVDQSFKLGAVDFLTTHGLTEEKLKIVSRTIHIGAEDIIAMDKTITGDVLYRLKPLKASEIALETFMDYSAMPDFVKMMRAIPGGSPFLCRSSDTEILTLQGWKTYEMLNIGDLIFSFDINTKKIVIKPVKKIHTFECNGLVNRIKSRSLDIVATDEHDLLIGFKENIELGKGKDGKRKRKNGNMQISRIKAKDLISTNSHVVVSAENAFDCRSDKIHSDDVVELVGWYVTEGHMTYKKVDGSFSSFSITQSKPVGVEKIRQLHKRFGSPGYIQVAKKEKWKREYPKMNYDNYEFHFKAEIKRFIDTVAPNKQLTIDFILQLTKEQLWLLFDTLVLADGHKDKNGQICFIQNPSITLESFQVLCLLLGKSIRVTKNTTHLKCKTVLVSNKNYRQLKRNMPTKELYSGIVWCPEVETTGTWIARRGGKVDITGNSFSYAMAFKTAKTAINNPAAFNKIGFMINEMNVDRSPEEKAAMEETYNRYLKSLTVMKMFGMWNTNVKNYVPYYTMNMFNPSERKYDDSFPSQMLKLSDKFPVFQDPIGQVFKDYFIQPWLLSGSGQIPQGQFGQPLYPNYDEQGNPIKVGLGTKAAYGARTFAESLVPGSLSYAGYPLGVAGISPEATAWLPSYGARSIAGATQGRSSIGAMTKEDAVRKTFRSILGRTGIPMYTLDASKFLNK